MKLHFWHPLIAVLAQEHFTLLAYSLYITKYGSAVKNLPCVAFSGGRNGYGAKLCNIFSTKFTVETACKEYKHSFKQV